MRIFSSVADAQQALAGTKKWDRTFEAIAASETLPRGITWSVGDSLTWRSIDPNDHEDVLTARRRYSRVVHCRTGRINISVVEAGTPTGPYSDLTDRQPIAEPCDHEPTRITLTAGQVVCFDPAEATRLDESDDFTGTLLHLTVEGRSFHNK